MNSGGGASLSRRMETNMRLVLLAAPLLLAGCGGTGVSSDTTNDIVAQNVVEAAANGTPARVAAAVDCNNKPDFVPVQQGAEVTTCISGPDGVNTRHVSGTIVYLTDDDPRHAIAWSRGQANASGLAPRQASDTRYSAGEEGKRSLMILAEPFEGRTRVTVNWGKGV
jgi:hypothetical protein